MPRVRNFLRGFGEHRDFPPLRLTSNSLIPRISEMCIHNTAKALEHAAPKGPAIDNPLLNSMEWYNIICSQADRLTL